MQSIARCSCTDRVWPYIFILWRWEENHVQGTERQPERVRWLESNFMWWHRNICCRKFVARLYDSKARFTCDHGDLNKLRSRIAQQKDAILVKLPPCEATFRQHVLRVSLQVYIWTSSSITQPPVKSPLKIGWVNKNGLVLVYFDEQTSSDFLQDLLCTCNGKTLCSKGCVCFEQNLSCTEPCPCQGNFSCNNSNTHTFTDDSDEEVDTYNFCY